MLTQTAYTLPVFGQYCLIWPYSMDAFAVFLDIFNTREPSIKFKSSVSKSSIDYLDTTISKDPDNSKTLSSKVFFKQTDTHQLLHKHSFHLTHTFKGLIKSPNYALFSPENVPRIRTVKLNGVYFFNEPVLTKCCYSNQQLGFQTMRY